MLAVAHGLRLRWMTSAVVHVGHRTWTTVDVVDVAMYYSLRLTWTAGRKKWPHEGRFQLRLVLINLGCGYFGLCPFKLFLMSFV